MMKIYNHTEILTTPVICNVIDEVSREKKTTAPRYPKPSYSTPRLSFGSEMVIAHYRGSPRLVTCPLLFLAVYSKDGACIVHASFHAPPPPALPRAA